MPLNCPSNYPVPGYDCPSCRFYNASEDSCRARHPEIPLADILTSEERFARLEQILLQQIKPPEKTLNTQGKKSEPKLIVGVEL